MDTPNGEVLLITVPHTVDGTTIDEVPVDEIGEIADDAAKDMVDDLASGETPVVEAEDEAESASESESESEEETAKVSAPEPLIVEDVVDESVEEETAKVSAPEPLIVEDAVDEPLVDDTLVVPEPEEPVTEETAPEEPVKKEDDKPRVCEKHVVDG